MSTSLPCFLLRGALTPGECLQRIAEAERAGFSATGGDYPPRYRDNDRLVRDDPALAEALFARLGPLLPQVLTDADGTRWQLRGLNPRFRACRYRGGQRFCIHQDGAWAPTPQVRSRLTLQLYLNDAAGFTGGRTRYYAARDADAPLLGAVTPEAGSAVVFDHQLWHDGEAVTQGTKYVLRTDVLYAREDAPQPAGPDVLEGHRGYVWSVCALADGRLATGSRDCTVRLWAERDGAWQAQAVLRGHTASVVALAEDARGQLWSASRDRGVRVWAGDTSRVVGRHAGAVLCLTRLADGRMASGGADGLIQLWTPDGALAGTLSGHGGWVWALAALPDGRLASASEDGSLRLWSLASGACVRLSTGVPLRALAVAGTRLYTGDAEGTLARWETGEAAAQPRQQRPRAHAGAVCTLALCADGTLASGGEDDALRRHAPEDLTALASRPHGGFVRSLAPLADGRLASASYEGTVRVGR